MHYVLYTWKKKSEPSLFIVCVFVKKQQLNLVLKYLELENVNIGILQKKLLYGWKSLFTRKYLNIKQDIYCRESN